MPAASCKWRKWKGWVVLCSWGVTEGSSGVPLHCPTTLKVLVSKGQIDLCKHILYLIHLFQDVFFCFFFLPFLCPDSAVEGVSSSSSTKDVGSSSPLTDRKKHRRKKSMNQKGDATLGQADGKRQELKMCRFFYIQHLNSREVTFYKFTQDFISTFIIFSFSLWLLFDIFYLLMQPSAKCGNLKALVA